MVQPQQQHKESSPCDVHAFEEEAAEDAAAIAKKAASDAANAKKTMEAAAAAKKVADAAAAKKTAEDAAALAVKESYELYMWLESILSSGKYESHPHCCFQCKHVFFIESLNTALWN
jgi:hypothetical protein